MDERVAEGVRCYIQCGSQEVFRYCQEQGYDEVFRDVGSAFHEPDDPDFIELIEAPFEPDAALLLCSDGLHEPMTEDPELSCALKAVARRAEAASYVARVRAEHQQHDVEG